MPKINIYEHSETYSFQTKNLAYARVATPITAVWGPTYNAYDEDVNPDWQYFSAGYRGTTDFVNTFKGPNNTLGAREKSYDYALKLLSSGYDVLVKRVDGYGSVAGATIQTYTAQAEVEIIQSLENPNSPYGVFVQANEFGLAGNDLKIVVTRTTARNTGTIVISTEGEPINVPTPGTRVECSLKVYKAAKNADGTVVDPLNVITADELIESRSATFIETAVNGAPGAVNQVIPFNSTIVTVTNNYLSAAYMPGDSYDNEGVFTEWTAPLYGITTGGETGDLTQVSIPGKWAGTYGNQLKVRFRSELNDKGFRIGTIEVFDRNNQFGDNNTIVRTDQLLEVLPVAFEIEAASDARPMVEDVSSAYLGQIKIEGDFIPEAEFVVSMSGGTDSGIPAVAIDGDAIVPVELQIKDMVRSRFDAQGSTFLNYISDMVGTTWKANEDGTYTKLEVSDENYIPSKMKDYQINQLWNQQLVQVAASQVIKELTDPLVYDWDALVMGIADDQYIPDSWKTSDGRTAQTADYAPTTTMLTMFEVAANSKCGAALVGTPFGLSRGTENSITGQRTGAVKFMNDLADLVGTKLSTFGELVGPWSKTTLPINGANSWVTPEIAHLLLIISATGVGGQNKWWTVPAGMLGTGIVHTPEYKIKKAYLDIIQNHEQGVCFNPLMPVPGKGFTCFGNSTLWKKPLGSYNALQNLSTRFLTNRVKQRIWDTALQILFKYNNQNAYSHFYAGVSPLLDEMRAVGALTSTEANPWGYRITMNPDIINLDRINANTVIGRVELAVTGVIDTVDVDLFLLPPTAFQDV